jgi:hypothetical protein
MPSTRIDASIILSKDPTYWLNRAVRTQAIAEGMVHQEYKVEMLAVAEGYRRMAKMAQERNKPRGVFVSLVDRLMPHKALQNFF